MCIVSSMTVAVVDDAFQYAVSQLLSLLLR